MIVQPPSLQRLSDVAGYLVDERVGVIRSVTEAERKFGAPNLFCFYAKACNTKAFGAQRNFSDAGGASMDRSIALAKAIGEAVERYCSAIYDRNELPFYSYKSAPFPCVPPSTFALYSEVQYSSEGFPYQPFTPETAVRWTQAVNLDSGESCYLPAAMVFLPYYFKQKDGEGAILQPISTGLACHCSMAEAAVSGICEVIERDAVMITWQARMARPHIAIESLSEQNRELVRRYKEAGASVFLFNITMDHGVPTIFSVLRSRAPDLPALIVAASAHLDPEHAVRKSLEELALTRRSAQHLKQSMPALLPDEAYKNITNQDSHLRFYCDQENTRLAEFLFESTERIDFQDLPNVATEQPDGDLKVLTERIRGINHDVYLADVTTPDIRGLGLCVVRAVIPGFQPLFFGHRFRALGGTRLWEVPQKLGYPGITHHSGDYPFPHPYP